jgi:pimeloyl-ACP methyl ester carboxylesterase
MLERITAGQKQELAMPYTTVGSDRVFYARRTALSPEAPHLILVHGAGGSHQHWGAAVRNLHSANVYALDLPGHARSSGKGRASIADYASLVVGFMDALGLQRAVIAGHSMGGATAMTTALDYPQRVAGLVLVGTGARLRVLPKILEGTLNDFENTVELICQYAYAPQAPRELAYRGQQQMLQVVPQTIHDDFVACNAFDAMSRLAEIRCPTLIICGTQDALTPVKYSSLLAEHIAGAELVTVQGAGHMVMAEKPDEVAEAIASALARWNL